MHVSKLYLDKANACTGMEFQCADQNPGEGLSIRKLSNVCNAAAIKP